MTSEKLPRTSVNPWQTRASRVVYETSWLRLREDQVVKPDGSAGTYGYMEAPYPVAVIAALDAARQLYLVREWRYGWQRDSWELPGGRCEAGEDPLAGAQRELLEEAGIRAQTWTPLGSFFVSALLATPFHLFLARDIEQGLPHRDPEEQDMIAQAVPFDAAVEAALDGTIVHAASISSILRLEHYLRAVPSGSRGAR